MKEDELAKLTKLCKDRSYVVDRDVLLYHATERDFVLSSKDLVDVLQVLNVPNVVVACGQQQEEEQNGNVKKEGEDAEAEKKRLDFAVFQKLFAMTNRNPLLFNALLNHDFVLGRPTDDDLEEYYLVHDKPAALQAQQQQQQQQQQTDDQTETDESGKRRRKKQEGSAHNKKKKVAQRLWKKKRQQELRKAIEGTGSSGSTITCDEKSVVELVEMALSEEEQPLHSMLIAALSLFCEDSDAAIADRALAQQIRDKLNVPEKEVSPEKVWDMAGLILQMLGIQAHNYIVSQGSSKFENVVVSHPHTFMLLSSLVNLLKKQLELNEESVFTVTAMRNCFRILGANLLHLLLKNIDPGTVGLGHPASAKSANAGTGGSNNEDSGAGIDSGTIAGGGGGGATTATAVAGAGSSAATASSAPPEQAAIGKIENPSAEIFCDKLCAIVFHFANVQWNDRKDSRLVKSYASLVNQATFAWTLGIPMFYPTHAQRKRVLMDLLQQPQQSNALLVECFCARMMQPELIQSFLDDYYVAPIITMNEGKEAGILLRDGDKNSGDGTISSISPDKNDEGASVDVGPDPGDSESVVTNTNSLQPLQDDEDEDDDGTTSGMDNVMVMVDEIKQQKTTATTIIPVEEINWSLLILNSIMDANAMPMHEYERKLYFPLLSFPEESGIPSTKPKPKQQNAASLSNVEQEQAKKDEDQAIQQQEEDQQQGTHSSDAIDEEELMLQQALALSLVEGSDAAPTTTHEQHMEQDHKQEEEEEEEEELLHKNPTVLPPPYFFRAQFVRCLQDGMLHVPGSTRKPNDPNSNNLDSQSNPLLVLEEAKCAETIELSANGRSATQKSDKEWGTALAQMPITKAERMYRWSVRLDKCEKGHVFIGVATQNANSSTYLGGDRYGWGLIGTKVLWHNRSKLRSFGTGFRTGDMITVTLDTLHGTMSYALTRNGKQTDWGVAFRNLSEYCSGSSALYPAVALYQRGDSVTLLSPPPESVLDGINPAAPSSFADPLGFSADDLGDGSKSFRQSRWPFQKALGFHMLAPDARVACMTQLNESLMLTEGTTGSSTSKSLIDIRSKVVIQMHLTVLMQLIDRYGQTDLLVGLLTPMLATLSLWPQRFFDLSFSLEILRTCVKLLDTPTAKVQTSVEQSLNGKWDIASFHPLPQKYSLEFEMKPRDNDSEFILTGVGHGDHESKVNVDGHFFGNKVDFMETWERSQTKSLVSMRLMPDGKLMIGVYKNMEGQKTGDIIGFPTTPNQQDDDHGHHGQWFHRSTICSVLTTPHGKRLLGVLAGKMGAVLIQNTTHNIYKQLTPPDQNESRLLRSSLFEGGFPQNCIDTFLQQQAEICGTHGHLLLLLSGHTVKKDKTINKESEVMSMKNPAQPPPPPTAAVVGRGDDKQQQKNELLWGLEDSEDIQFLEGFIIHHESFTTGSLSHHLSRGGSSDSSAASTTATLVSGGATPTPKSSSIEALDAWMMKFAGKSVFLTVGGASMRSARLATIASMLVHTGLLQEARLLSLWLDQTTDALQMKDNAESGAQPSRMLISVWKAAQRIIEWVVRAKQQSGSTYAVLAEKLYVKALFLLRIRPAKVPFLDFSAIGLSKHLSTVGSGSFESSSHLKLDIQQQHPHEEDTIHDISMSKLVTAEFVNRLLFDSSLQGLSEERKYLYVLEQWKRVAKYVTRNNVPQQTHSQSLESVVLFLKGSFNVKRLEKLMLEGSWRVLQRAAGLNIMALLVGARSRIKHISTKLLGSAADMRVPAYVKMAVLEWIAPALLDETDNILSGTKFANVKKKPIQQATQNAIELFEAQNKEHLPQLSPLDFVDFGLIAEKKNPMLQGGNGNGTTSSDTKGHYLSNTRGCGQALQNVVHDAFQQVYSSLAADLERATTGNSSDMQLSIIQCWNISLMSRDHEFLSRIGIFRIFHQVLSNARSVLGGIEDAQNPEALYNQIRTLTQQRIMKATLRVVHLLASQVVLNGAEETPSFSLRSPTASLLNNLRTHTKPSGAETLGRSVFEMLFTELETALEGLQQQQSAAAKSNPSSVATTGSTTNYFLSTFFPETFVDEEEYCYQVVMLLYTISVNGLKTCREYLTGQDRLDTLLRAAASSSPRIQHRTLRFLSRLLPSIREIRNVDDDTPFVTKLLDLIAEAYPPHYGTMLQLVDNHGWKDGTVEDEELSEKLKSGQRNTEYTMNVWRACDVVSLLRRLLSTSSWSSTVQSVLNQALQGGTEKNLVRLWAAISVLGGHFEHLRICGKVVFSPFLLSRVDELYFDDMKMLTQRGGVLAGFNGSNKESARVLLQDPSMEMKTDDASSSTKKGTKTTGTAAGTTAPAAASSSTSSSGGNEGDAPGKPNGGRKEIRLMSATMDTDMLVPVAEVKLTKEIILNQDTRTEYTKLVSKVLEEILAPPIDSEVSSSSSEENDDDDDEEEEDGGVDDNNTQVDEEAGEQSSKAKDEVEKAARAAKRERKIHPRNEELIDKVQVQTSILKSLVEMVECNATPSFDFFRSLIELASRHTDTCGIQNIIQLESWWRIIVGRYYKIQNDLIQEKKQKLRQGGKTSGPTGEGAQANPDGAQDEEEEMSPALKSMLELGLGFPKEVCQVALDRCGDDVEAAIDFCLEHASDMDVLVQAAKQQKDRQKEASRRSVITEKLVEMGFPERWCERAIDMTGENFENALTWILSNGETLQAEDERAQQQQSSTGTTAGGSAATAEGDQQGANASAQDDNQSVGVDMANKDGEITIPLPYGVGLLTTTSGMDAVDITDDLVVSLKPSSNGFPSVGARDLLLNGGCWYFEVTLMTDNCMQIGWADAAFTGNATEGDGVGDDGHSWSFDGYRQLFWHSRSEQWGRKWKVGDVVCAAIDLDKGEIWFGLNGDYQNKMGRMVHGLCEGKDYIRGLYPAASLNRTEKMQFNFGSNKPFKHGPPEQLKDCRPIIEAFSSKHNLRSHNWYESMIPDVRVWKQYEMHLVEDAMEEEIPTYSQRANKDRYFPQQPATGHGMDDYFQYLYGANASSSSSSSSSRSRHRHHQRYGSTSSSRSHRHHRHEEEEEKKKNKRKKKTTKEDSTSSSTDGSGKLIDFSKVNFEEDENIDENYYICVLSEAIRSPKDAVSKLEQASLSQVEGSIITTGQALMTLYARKAVVHLLEKWGDMEPTMQTSVVNDLTNELKDAPMTILRLLKLVSSDLVIGSGEPPGNISNRVGGSNGPSMHKKNNCAALMDRLSHSLSYMADNIPHLEQVIVDCICGEVARASMRLFASIEWENTNQFNVFNQARKYNLFKELARCHQVCEKRRGKVLGNDDDEAVSNVFSFRQDEFEEDDITYCDEVIAELPNIQFALWLTDFSLRRCKNDVEIVQPLYSCWNLALHSPGTSLKSICAQQLIKFLEYAQSNEKLYRSLVTITPCKRILRITERYLERNGTTSPVHSSYVQGLVELSTHLIDSGSCAVTDEGGVEEPISEAMANCDDLIDGIPVSLSGTLLQYPVFPLLDQYDIEETKNQGFKFSDHVKIGDYCVRGPDWQHGDQDGGVGSIGVILDVIPNGSKVQVKWYNNLSDGDEDTKSVATNDEELSSSSSSNPLRTFEYELSELSVIRLKSDSIHHHDEASLKTTFLLKQAAEKLNERGTYILHNGPEAKRTAKLGDRLRLGVRLWLNSSKGENIKGTLELSDYNATIGVEGERRSDGKLRVVETHIIQGTGKRGWSARFGQEEWIPGTEYIFEEHFDDQSASITFKGNYEIKLPHVLVARSTNNEKQRIEDGEKLMENEREGPKSSSERKERSGGPARIFLQRPGQERAFAVDLAALEELGDADLLETLLRPLMMSGGMDEAQTRIISRRAMEAFGHRKSASTSSSSEGDNAEEDDEEDEDMDEDDDDEDEEDDEDEDEDDGKDLEENVDDEEHHHHQQQQQGDSENAATAASTATSPSSTTPEPKDEDNNKVEKKKKKKKKLSKVEQGVLKLKSLARLVHVKVQKTTEENAAVVFEGDFNSLSTVGEVMSKLPNWDGTKSQLNQSGKLVPKSSLLHDLEFVGGGNVMVLVLTDMAQDSEDMVAPTTSKEETSTEPLVMYGSVDLQSQELFILNSDAKGSSMVLDDDNHLVTLSSSDSDSRGFVLGNIGFSSGIHYWEVKVENASQEYGSVFIGVSERPAGVYPAGTKMNFLKRWDRAPSAYGFVNFRATLETHAAQGQGNEQIYGEFYGVGDTVGVCLDMEQGILSFFLDGIKYGQHTMKELGIAFSGAQLQGKSDNRMDFSKPLTLYPMIGLRRSRGNSVRLTHKWHSIPRRAPMRLIHDVSEMAHILKKMEQGSSSLPEKFLERAWMHYQHWSQHFKRYPSRGRGMFVEVDISAKACKEASGKYAVFEEGKRKGFRAGDRVRVLQSCGRDLEAPEEACVLGAHRGRIWYRVESQQGGGHEGMEEGASLAWYWEPHELGMLEVLELVKEDETEGEQHQTEDNDAITSLQEFCDLQKSATLAKDIQLVQIINHRCNVLGVDPMNIQLQDLVSNIKEEKSAMVARACVLRLLNCMIRRSLPFISLNDQSNDYHDGKTTEPGGPLDDAKAEDQLQQHHGLGHLISKLRGVIFTWTKKNFWESVLNATTTHTPLATDEYEDPQQIRMVNVNRIRATSSKLASISDDEKRFETSVFGQVYGEIAKWSDHSLRRAYVGKGHGGQKRSFKVKFLGEGVKDYGGPYRAVFDQIADELQSDQEWHDSRNACLLPLFVPSSNRYNSTGDVGRDKFVFRPGPAMSTPKALDRFVFLGKLVGMAVRHGLQMGLDLPSFYWKLLAKLELALSDLEEVDSVFVNTLGFIKMKLEQQPMEDRSAEAMAEILGVDRFMEVSLSDGTVVPVIPGGSEVALDFSNAKLYCELAEKIRLEESLPQLEAFHAGLAAVLPVQLFSLFTEKELEVLVCGQSEMDLKLLKQCTEYEGGVSPNDPHVQYFWEVLDEMTNEQRTEFLKFTWARSRMPDSAADMPMNFKITTATGGAVANPDAFLPSAQTCFFSLALPKYKDKETMKKKLLYAIQCCNLMDADYHLRNAEGAWANAT